MEAKSVLYAAVGAPVVVARKVSEGVGTQVEAFRSKVGEEKTNYSEAAQKTIEGWAVEGEKVVTKVGDQKVVGEISSKVDLDQAKEQVTKLRDQLEEMLATWKTSFRPEKASGQVVDAVEVVADEASEAVAAAADKVAGSEEE